MRKLALALLVILLAACASPAAPASPTYLPSLLLPTDTQTPLPSSTATSNPHTTVDASTMERKLLMGYQGWFSCLGDGSGFNGFLHWFFDSVPDAAHFRMDMWPDMSELAPSELCPTSMQFPDGSLAPVYSAYNPQTVMRHFRWMSDYGIDGVFLQRFGSELYDPTLLNIRNVVTENVRLGAEANGRVFAMMYDTSGMEPATFVDKLESDWKYLVDVAKVTESPSYLHHNGKPVLAIWGLGFTEHPGTPAQAIQLVDFFEHNPDPKYQVTLMGGVPTWWRTLQNDSQSDPAWGDFYCSLDILSPWTVGRYSNNLEADLYKLTMQADMAAASTCGVEYMPVVYPGTSFHNSGQTPYNLIPRRGGTFYWRQVYNAVSIGAPMIYNAMFDEVDEATAMFKIAETSTDQPTGVDLIPMDAEGYSLPNDWYLQLAGVAQQMLRGELPLTAEIPLDMEELIPLAKVGQARIRISFTTSSDWASLDVTGGVTLDNPELVSVSPEANNLGANGNHFSVGQPLDQALAGQSVSLVVDAWLTGLQAGGPMHFSLQSGAVGQTTVELSAFVDGIAAVVDTQVMPESSRGFDVPAEMFLSP